MRIGFIGLGKLGLPCALAMEEKGHEVCGFDVSESVCEIVKTRKIPYLEERAQELLQFSRIETVPLAEVVKRSEIIFVAVQTPHEPRFEGVTPLPEDRADFDYSFLKEAVRNLANELRDQGEDRIVAIISTVLPGTLKREIEPHLNERVKLCYNPYFIAMGTCIEDFCDPEFTLLGCEDDWAARRMAQFYDTIHKAPLFVTSIVNAEMIKVFYNTFITMKICFANTVMEIADAVGGDCDEVTAALSLATKRIISNAYMRGGMGDGGGCHPRDNIALSWLARKLDISYDFFGQLMKCRERQMSGLAARALLECRLFKVPCIVLGKTFKPESNLEIGSPARLFVCFYHWYGPEPDVCYDPYVDDGPPPLDEKATYFIATQHEVFKTYRFPEGSTVIDPFGYIPPQLGVTVRHIGRHQ